ncbi:NAD(P)H-dependent flavin oxidoreductase [Shouchella shacheensis]|uniref:NAD(P)H-dependent flavin oxidoreductase n=1 Tax=Shouchella shacheensis TaxID=1649580 RepID=UPI0009EB340E|nr:nitronate monooxygenase [Shouchella shacheensis]
MRTICETLQIEHPIIQGGMGNISDAGLVASVSEAGGLGTIGCGTMSPEKVYGLIQETKAKTDRPFAVNIPMNVSPYTKELIQLVMEQDVPVVSLSAGNPKPYIPLLQAEGIIVICLVAGVGHAMGAEAGGADVLVAEGVEAAGINSPAELTTFTLIPQICAHVSIPVVAAGGIADGRGLAAALMLGASGVQMGTRFIATKEAPYHEAYKQRVLQATDQETVVLGRSLGQVRRVLKGAYSEKILGLEKESLALADYMEMTSEFQHVKGAIEGDEENGFMNSGQIAGLIQDIPSVSELLKTMMSEAKAQIEKQAARLLRSSSSESR